MGDILIRAGSFIAIIVLGFVLRRVGFFKEGDFNVLSKITLKITLPASIVVSYAGMKLETSMLTLALLGLGGGAIYVSLAFLLNLRSRKEQRAFDIINFAGYNIGLFTMPFVQSFLGPVGVVATSLFDTGNAVVCLGGTYGIASTVKKGGGFSFRQIAKALLTSVPFVSYLIMAVWSLSGIPVPGALVSCAEVIKGANAFMAMLMIGVGFKLSANRQQIGYILKVLAVRYGVATALALLYYFVLPFPLEVRQALVILAFSPIGSAAPAFTAELKEDAGLASAVNSICILCSIVIMVVLLSVMLY